MNLMKDILKNLFLESADYPRFQHQPFLVVDWTTTGVVLSEVSFINGTAEVLRSQFESWPTGMQPASDPQGIGQWLKNVCEQNNLPTGAVAISVARRDLSLKLLELPPVADDELAALVALQVESRIQATGQPVAWDFLPHSAAPSETSRYVTLVSVSEAICQTLRGAAAAAGWNHYMLTSGDVLLAGQKTSPEAWQQHIQANRSKLEFCLCRYGVPVASYVTALPSAGRAPASDAAWVADQIPLLRARLLAASPTAWQSQVMSPEIRLSGCLAPAIAEALHRAGAVTLLEFPDERTGRTLAVASALRAESNPASSAMPCRLDLLKPRCLNQHSRKRRLAMRRTMVLSGVLLCSLIAFLFHWQQGLQSELTELEHQRRQLQQFVERGQDVLQRWAYVSRWQHQSLQTASEISEFARLVPDQERLIVTRLQLENMVDAKSGTLRIDGLAQSADDVLQMNNRILEHPEHYDLRPQGIEPAPQGSTFPSQFRIEAVLHNGTTVSQESR